MIIFIYNIFGLAYAQIKTAITALLFHRINKCIYNNNVYLYNN